MSTDAEIEQQIQEKGLTAPRVTSADLEAAIDVELYFTAAQVVYALHEIRPSTRGEECLTLCVLTLKNGFTIVGKSACASPENFDTDLGRKIARQDAVNQMWPLLGYALKENLSRSAS